MLKMPDDTVAQLQAKRFENGVEQDVERVNFLAAIDMIADLPTNAAFVMQRGDSGGNRTTLIIQVLVEGQFVALLLRLANVVRRRRHDQLLTALWQRRQKIQPVALIQHGIRFLDEVVCKRDRV